MSRIKIFLSICSLIQFTQGKNFIILGLNKRLEDFNNYCDVRITADFRNMEFEQFFGPVTLLDVKQRITPTFKFPSGPINPNVFAHLVGNRMNIFIFKYRMEVCALDLVIHLSTDEYDPDKYFHVHYQRLEYMSDKYMVIIRQNSAFLAENQTKVWGYYNYFRDHRIFVWTVIRGHGSKRDYVFHEHFFVIRSFGSENNKKTDFHMFQLKDSTKSRGRPKMDESATSIRKYLSWTPRAETNYRKIPRGINLPFHESNLNQEPSPYFIQFIRKLISPSNFTDWQVYHSAVSDMIGASMVPDETDSFNFITCLTSDTFWSIAKLFWKPYQPWVWAGLGATLFGTGIILVAVKVLGKAKLKFLKTVSAILFNLVEVVVSLGKTVDPRYALKLIFASWLLMSIILTNSYKGILIAFLSAPWAPQQDYNYFQQMKDFQFYAPVPPGNEGKYWDFCASLLFSHPNFSCPARLLERTMFGEFVWNSWRRLHPNNTIIRNQLLVFNDHLFALPRNESKPTFQKMISGEKVALVGSNTEIDERLTELRAEYHGIRFFKGTEFFFATHKKLAI